MDRICILGVGPSSVILSQLKCNKIFYTYFDSMSIIKMHLNSSCSVKIKMLICVSLSQNRGILNKSKQDNEFCKASDNISPKELLASDGFTLFSMIIFTVLYLLNFFKCNIFQV